MSKRIGILVGSLRKESFNKKIAKNLVEILDKKYSYEFIEIGDLPLYNEDIDQGNPPESYANFRNTLSSFDAFLFFTPEYNRSIPAVLKNALDVGSRPYGKSQWDGRPAAIVSVSPGAISAFGANHHLRQCLTFLNMPCLQQPEMYIGNVTKILDENGNINSDGTNELCKKFVQAFENWIEKF
ncbi:MULTISPECIES: NADPH-dependent FMN reductase [Sphingobacterium]|uniref:NAD(P)H-dependent oxidoreductase n=1 Tax=Sphingobacterium litopenaei TaxID=2763500 RepID=A0ABR7YAY4_9SPHI|nr:MULTISPECIES: NAD(P)H-dependent oxidoreductase [Sphingobacterium]MBD1428469.1 NAD(P)H-dependent oxidoreductase [Sphingobacterium litopenaei]NGM71727.1 NAD(P)H-dependent oxidoreductase [Sphingobacterium sp. SGL-16]